MQYNQDLETDGVNNRVYQAWLRFVRDGQAEDGIVRKEIIESWKRCRAEGLDPYARRTQTSIDQDQLQRRLHRYRDLIEAAWPFMQILEISVRGSGFITTLADRDGYVLKVCGDDEILKMAQENFYLPGCCRSEKWAGTNAIGLCLVEKKPFQVTGAEHYNIHHHPWTCSSAPIFSPRGGLLGAITLSGKSYGRHPHTLGLVVSAAEAIENKLKERELFVEKESLNVFLNSMFDSVSEGIIGLDGEEVITRVNAAACRFLGKSEGALIGRKIDHIQEFGPKILRDIRERKYFSAREVIFSYPAYPTSYLCSSKPIVGQDRKIQGTLLILREKRQVYRLVQELGGNYAKFQFEDIKGKNPALLRQIELAKIAARSDSRVLIVGESGTGKELFAQAIHNFSARRNGPFIAISCSAIPRDLVEAELFGYKEGAFTGARREGQVGKFELADKGTLFLDEIECMPLDIQAKVLRVLQQNEVMRLGDSRVIPIDVRVIAASNRDLLEEVENGNFREDLYYRLNVVEITIPPLRERLDDLDELIDHIIEKQALRMKRPKCRMSKRAMKVLRSYHWPGNVRELENCIERAMLLSDGLTIEPKHLPERILSRQPRLQLKEETLSMDEYTSRLIQAILEKNKGNISKTARELKISRSTLYRKLHEYGLLWTR